jgi:hypothetical protein
MASDVDKSERLQVVNGDLMLDPHRRTSGGAARICSGESVILTVTCLHPFVVFSSPTFHGIDFHQLEHGPLTALTFTRP